MIVILRPNAMGDGRLSWYKDAWTGFARRNGEEVMSTLDTGENEKRLLEDANRTNGRLVVVRPEFIPSPTFFRELDYMREEGILIVLLKKAKMYFNPGENQPYRSITTGLDKSLMVFQLAGQTRRTAPPRITGAWLERKRAMYILRLKQGFLGDSDIGASTRSQLGEVIPGISGTGSVVKMGCFGVGGDLLFSRDRQINLWMASVEAMATWHKWKK
jgi:hypothetical protein